MLANKTSLMRLLQCSQLIQLSFAVSLSKTKVLCKVWLSVEQNCQAQAKLIPNSSTIWRKFTVHFYMSSPRPEFLTQNKQICLFFSTNPDWSSFKWMQIRLPDSAIFKALKIHSDFLFPSFLCQSLNLQCVFSSLSLRPCSVFIPPTSPMMHLYQSFPPREWHPLWTIPSPSFLTKVKRNHFYRDESQSCFEL